MLAKQRLTPAAIAAKLHPAEVARINREAGLPEATNMPDLSIRDKGTYEGAVYEVPADVPWERIQFAQQKYMSKFGHALEKQGFTIKSMSAPFKDTRPGCPPDRQRFRIVAWVSRRPVTTKMTIPDSVAPALIAKGYDVS